MNFNECEGSTRAVITRRRKIDVFFPFNFSASFSSGCPYKCVFCAAGRNGSSEVIAKLFNIEQIASECRMLEKNSYLGIGGGPVEDLSDVHSHVRWEQFCALLNSLSISPFILCRYPGKTVIECLTGSFSPINATICKPVFIVSVFSADTKKNSEMEYDNVSFRERIKILEIFKGKGWITGLFVSPLMKGFNDSGEDIDNIFFAASGAADVIYFDYFSKYKAPPKRIFPGSFYETSHDVGHEIMPHADKLHRYFLGNYQKYKIRPFLPLDAYQNLDNKSRIQILLERMYYLRLLDNNIRLSYLDAASRISLMSDAVFSDLLKTGKLQTIRGIGRKIEKMIYEFTKEDYTSFEPYGYGN